MKTICWMIVLLLLAPSSAMATDLRGRVDALHRYSTAPFPARGVEVSLCIQTPGGLQVVAQYFTGGDGMYYLQNIPPGVYVLVVDRVLRFGISVFNTRLQDIPPILYRY